MYFVEKTKGLNIVKNFDYLLFSAVLLLSTLGFLVVRSATLTRADGGFRIAVSQLAGLVIGITLAVIMSYIDYKDFKLFGSGLYIVSVILLIVVLKFGSGEELGSRSWLDLGFVTLQPSEVAKVAFIMVASIFLERILEGQRRGSFIKLILYSSIIIGLVVIQKDFGTSMVFMAIFLIMLFICRVPIKYFVSMVAAIIPVGLIMWFFVLNEKRKGRIISFLYPELDPQGAGFNVLRSKYAIGSGQLWGKGLFEGIQTQNNMVPVKESDFIFSVIGEELGFIGAVVIVFLLFFILIRCIYIAKNSRDKYGSIMVIGVAGMIAVHTFENIGMSIGILPCTGIPLPFVSQGATNLVTNFMAIGIVLSVSARRKKVIFNSSQ
ncbi:FtsW/RodA/SpoVE family cell cycle protein [Pseudobacteroides cellulosolvens]|uniref:Cell cycle protein n=1 Tax=Pseudobacteroides cellulosolvens ATCC 35603 = DSM 2933 TaxID=398512 RepID=A0A0L6JGV2_9FIRM|nr:FtsW/RodA/SpoVE family cell cycle protein [Pseudobacteroides cellulosolvens]KNY24935.1 cell cycle protein [Pseudobacteroides cellulosolvens ATCC 35603 = DSM 2933]